MLSITFKMYRLAISDSYDIYHEQHVQFDALEARLRRREPVHMDVHFALPAIVPPVIAHVYLSSSPSYHNLDWDVEVFDSETRDPSGNSRPLQVH